MNKIRKYISLFLGITIALVLWNTPLVYADATIEATATVTGKNVVITGQISNATEETTVTFLAGNHENTKDILYVDEKALATTHLTVSSSILLVSANGTISTAEDVTLNVQLKSVATDLIDKSMTVNGTRTLSGTLPNVLSNATYELTIKGYEDYLFGDSVGCRIIGEKDDAVKVIASARNIEDFENRKFELNYDSAQLEAVSLWGAYTENSVGTGRKGDVTVLSYSPGKIVFQMMEIDRSRKLSGNACG